MSDRPPATLGAPQRLKTQRHFQRVYHRGVRAAGQWMTVVGCPRAPEDAPGVGPRLGLSVSKDHGGAVRRNKLKRLLRAAFRLEQQHLPQDWDLILIPRQRLDDFPLAALREELCALAQRARQKPRPNRSPRPPHR